MEIISGVKDEGYRVSVLYGPHGVGKTHFCAQLEKPLFIDTDGGSDEFEIDRLPKPQTLSDLQGCLRWFAEEGHKDYTDLVYDSFDHGELLIIAKVCEEFGIDALTDVDFGKATNRAKEIAKRQVNVFRALRDKCKVNVWILAHDDLVRIEDPEYAPFDQHLPKTVLKGTAHYLCEKADDVLYAHYKIRTKTEKGAFGKETNKPVGTNDKIVRARFKPTVQAKNRSHLPETFDFDYATYKQLREEGKVNA